MYLGNVVHNSFTLRSILISYLFFFTHPSPPGASKAHQLLAQFEEVLFWWRFATHPIFQVGPVNVKHWLRATRLLILQEPQPRSVGFHLYEATKPFMFFFWLAQLTGGWTKIRSDQLFHQDVFFSCGGQVSLQYTLWSEHSTKKEHCTFLLMYTLGAGSKMCVWWF